MMPGIDEILDHIRKDFFGPIRKVEPLKELNVEFIMNPHEAASGARQPLDIPIYEHCPACDGRGGCVSLFPVCIVTEKVGFGEDGRFP